MKFSVTKFLSRLLISWISIAFLLPVAPAFATDSRSPFQVLARGKKNTEDRARKHGDRGKRQGDINRDRKRDKDRARPPRDKDRDRTRPTPPRDRDRDRTRPRPPRRDRDDNWRRRPRPPRRPVPPPRRPPPRRDDDDGWRRYPRRPFPPSRPLPPPRDNDRVSRCHWDHQSVACSLLRFRWSRPHNAMALSYGGGVSTNLATHLGLQSLFTQGKTGRTGTLGISRLLVEYSNGEVENMLPLIRSLYPERVTNKDNIFLAFEGDQFQLPLRPHRYVMRIYVTADSWIDQYTDAYLALTLDR